MNNLLRAGLLAGAGLLATGAAAIANPSTWLNNGRQYVVFDGLNAGDRITVKLDNQALERRVTANACGWLNLSTTTTYPTPADVAVSSDSGVTFGASTDVSAVGQQFLRCSNGVVVDGAGAAVTNPSAPFLDSSGRTVLPGYTQNARYVVRYVGEPATISRKVNGCGFVQLTNDPVKLDLTGFEYDGSNYTLAGLTTQNPPRCSRINGVQVRYNPI